MARKGSQSEQWRNVVGYEDTYDVSDMGRVRSKFNGVFRILKPQLSKKVGGYYRVRLYKSKMWKTMTLHRLVAEAFIRPRSKGEAINHKDFNRVNNNLSNLEIVSFKENVRHSAKAGRMGQAKGSKNGRSVLKEKQVLQIRKRLEKGEECTSISRILGVSISTVSLIKLGKIWSHI